MAAVAVLAIAIFLSAQSPSLPNGAGAAIVDGPSFEAAREKMSGLALDRIRAYDGGAQPSPEDLKKLREGSDILDRMIQFAPAISANYFLSGKLHSILGETSIAIERYRQCAFTSVNEALLRPQDASAIKGAAAQANCELSILLLGQNDKQGAFEAADEAVQGYPDTPDFLIARASALNELRRVPEAKKDLEHALKIDPNNTKAKSLLRFISK